MGMQILFSLHLHDAFRILYRQLPTAKSDWQDEHLNIFPRNGRLADKKDILALYFIEFFLTLPPCSDKGKEVEME